jgi:hypothetical protein
MCRLKQHTVQVSLYMVSYPKTGVAGIPLTLNLGHWIEVSAEHPAGEKRTVLCGEEI